MRLWVVLGPEVSGLMGEGRSVQNRSTLDVDVDVEMWDGDFFYSSCTGLPTYCSVGLGAHEQEARARSGGETYAVSGRSVGSWVRSDTST